VATQGVTFDAKIQGRRIYFAEFGNPAGGANDAHARFARSLDQGKTWSTFDDPCGTSPQGENDAIDFSPAPGGSLAVLCQPRSRERPPFVLVSSNAGTTFRRLHAIPFRAHDSGLQIAAASAQVIAVDFDRGSAEGIAVSRDGGSTWNINLIAAIPSGWVIGFVGFQDARTARAVFGTAYIWTTRDGGRTWRRSAPFAP
jgi:hypothetical protein